MSLEKLNFKQHIDTAILKINKHICNKKTQTQFATEILNDNLQSFLKPLIDYRDIIYDQPQNESFCEKLESVQYKTAPAITVAIQGTSRDKIYEKLGLVSLKARRYKRISMFKIMKEEAPTYLINLVTKCETNIRTRNNSTPTFSCRIDCLKLFFFPSIINDWFNLDLNKFRDNFNIQKQVIVFYLPNSNEHIQYF